MATRTQRRQAARSEKPAPAAEGRWDAVRLLRVAWALSFAATLLISRPLWLSGRDYPVVPVFAWLPQPPFPLDLLLFAAVLLGLSGAAVAHRSRRPVQGVLAILVIWLMLDQTRWQPYVVTYVAAGVALLLATDDPERRARAMAPLQLVLACTYAWSGLHKFNHSYATTEFGVTAAPLFRWMGIDSAAAGGAVAALALGTAAVELAIGVGLLIPRTRRMAVVGAVSTHAFILLMLGPLGQNANAVVWPWNAFTAAAVCLLFWRRDPAARFDDTLRTWLHALRSGTLWFAPRPVSAAWYAALVFCGVAPALSLAQLWDAALSFQLYAGKQRQASIAYAAGHAGELPRAAQRSVRVDGVVNLAQWSMEEMHVTPVLEPRVVRGIGRAMARRAPDANARVMLHGPPDLLTGERTLREWTFEGPHARPVEILLTR